MMPFAPEVEEISSGIVFSSSGTLVEILRQWPRLFIALGLIGIGYVCMLITESLLTYIFSKLPIHTLSKKLGFTELLKRAQITSPAGTVIAQFIGGYIFTMFFLASANILHLTAISEFLNKLIYHFTPSFVVALFIILIGFQVAGVIGSLIESTLNILGNHTAKIIRMAGTGIIMLFTVLAAIWQLGIADELVRIAFIGLIALISLAGGLAIGLGAKDFVHDILIKTLEKDREK